MKNKISIVTLGCSKNIVDSEVLLAQLKANKIEAKHDITNIKTDIVLINTCGFINDAKEESINTILQFIEAKKRGLIKKVIVFGCLSERYKDDLKNEIPEVDEYFGVGELSKILNSVNVDYKKEIIGERELSTPSHYAYLKISEGCNRKCSFCAIPLIRGIHVSKPINEIIKETKLLAQKGVKEIIVIAQDTTYYGLDIYKKRELAKLLNKISEIDGIEWIRLQYAYPADFPVDVLDVIKSNSKICKYLDIPFQHISDVVLKSMQRSINKKKTLDLIDKIRSKIPDVSLRTSLIVGYPNETEKEFNELTDFVSEIKFDRLGVFTYSNEENTKAFKLEDVISEEVKQERADELMAIQQDISSELNKNKIGRNLKILIDRREGEYYIGRTEFDSPEVDNEVLIKSKSKKVQIGSFVNVKITDSNEYDLIGELTK